MAIKPISSFPKFTNIPNWATHVAQHADGEWWFYESLPKLVVNIGFKSHDRDENHMPANIKTNPNNWETTATNIKSLNEWSYQDVYGKRLPERFILLGPDGEKLPSPIILKTTSSLKALNTYLNDRNFDYFKQRSHDIEALSIYDTKLNKTIEILFKASPTFWQRTSHPETSSKYKYMFNNKLTEAKSTIKLDSLSGTDSDKISDFLNSKSIPFKKVGPIFTISLDRNTPKASVILSQLRRISKFDEVNESISEASFNQGKLSKSFQASLNRKPLKAKYIAIDSKGNALSTPIKLKTASSIYALWKFMNSSPYSGFEIDWKNGGAFFDLKTNSVVAVIVKSKSNGWDIFYEKTPALAKLFSAKPKPAALQYIADSKGYFTNVNDMSESKLNEMTQPLYKDWDQFEHPSKIKVYLNTGKTLEITPKQVKGGKRIYDAILQAFIDDKFEVTNTVIQHMTESNNPTSKSVTELIESIVSQTILEAYEPVIYDPNIHKTLDSGAMDFEFNKSEPNTIQVFAPFKEEPNVMVHMKINKKYFDDLLDDGYIESQEDLDSMEMNYDNLRGAVVTLMKRPELLKRYLVMQENVISELNLSAAGVKEFLMFIKRYPKYLEELGFVSFKVLLDTIKSGDVNVVYDLMQEILPVLKKETNPKIKQDAMALMH